MTPGAVRRPRSLRQGERWVVLFASLLIAAIGLCWVSVGHAQAASPGKSAAELGAPWRELKPAQQTALRPLEREWPRLSSRQKDKWIELSDGFAKRPSADQARIQERMSEWARMSTQERSQARLNFEEAKQLPMQDRKARWEAYQALPPEKKRQLAARAAPATGATAARPAPPRDNQPKSNIVPNPAYAAPPKLISPSVVQAGPGATTTLITKRPTPPTHQQTGLPKIAATPEFVNKATLLPRRGPQGATMRSAGVPGSEASAAR